MPLSFTPTDLARSLGVQDDGDDWKRARTSAQRSLFQAMIKELTSASRKDKEIFTVGHSSCLCMS